MKNKIIVLVIALLLSAMPKLQAQASDSGLDSLIQSQTKVIKNANSDLVQDLKMKGIQNRFPGRFKKIARYRKKSVHYLSKVNETDDFHQQLIYSNRALKFYNKARKLYAILTPN